jgi:lipoprotein-anchoring transpeptidase ErfK/SrfK
MINPVYISISIPRQRLYLFEATPDGDNLLRDYPVSTAANGAGEAMGSYCTPRGRHRIAQKIGAGQPLHAVFKARVPTGEIWSPQLDAERPDEDWILTRILWLEGLEPGKNQGGTVDTQARYIYIHGASEEHRIGAPASHGCIRMRNADVLDLFERVEAGTAVEISERV